MPMTQSQQNIIKTKLENVKQGEKFTFDFESGDYTYIRTVEGYLCIETGRSFIINGGEHLEVRVLK